VSTISERNIETTRNRELLLDHLFKTNARGDITRTLADAAEFSNWVNSAPERHFRSTRVDAVLLALKHNPGLKCEFVLERAKMINEFLIYGTAPSKDPK
jgi:hypothetical protein